ncbi:MAG: class II aldolase [Clostridiaceae bacterium]|nr:class II aldolase [Clostridiaceae bacterium]
MQNKKEIKLFSEFSKKIGDRIDYVQGGGGNTSYKVDDQTMLIKASGYYLNQVKEQDGYAVLNYPKIQKFFYNHNVDDFEDIEVAGSTAVKEAIIKVDNLPELRPSVESGFHSILGSWVAHTHSVYTNIILCSRSAEKLLKAIFSKFSYIYIPYVNPGSRLTAEIYNEMKKFEENNGKIPDVIFLQNHGVIVHAEDMNACYDLHEEVNQIIGEYFSINLQDYPAVEIKKIDENKYISNTNYLINSFKNNEYSQELLLERPLYPDQIVYLRDVLGETAIINQDTGKITYEMPYKQAVLIEEALTAIIFIMKNIEEKGLEVQYMHDSEQDFIKNWESEKYRKELAEQE